MSCSPSKTNSILRPAFSFLLLFQSILISQRAYSQEENLPSYKTPDPAIRRVQVKEDGTLQVFVATVAPLTETRSYQVPAKKQRFEYREGTTGIEIIEVEIEVEVQAEYKVNMDRVDVIEWRIPSSEYRAINLQGKNIDLATLKRQFKSASPAIVSTFRDSVIDTWSLPLFKEDTVMFITTSEQPPASENGGPLPPPAPVSEIPSFSGTAPAPREASETRSAQAMPSTEQLITQSLEADFELVTRIVTNRDRTDVVRQTAIAVANSLINDAKRKERLKAELHQVIEANDTSDSLLGIALTTLQSLSMK